VPYVTEEKSQSRCASVTLVRSFCDRIICDVSYRNNRCLSVRSAGRNQEGIMSLLYQTHQTTDLKRRDYGFVLALVCMVLALVVASVIFTPAPVGAGITSEITSVGP